MPLRTATAFFGLFFILVTTVGILSIWNVKNMAATQNAISNTNRIFYELEQVNSNYHELSNSVRTFLISGDTVDLSHRGGVSSRILHNLIFLKSALRDSSAIADLNALSQAFKTRTETFGEVIIKLRKEQGFVEAQKFFVENDDQALIVQHIPQLSQKIKDRLELLLSDRIQASEKIAQWTVLIIIFGTIISLCLVFFVIYIFIKDQKQIRQQLKVIEEAKAELQLLANQLQKHNAKLLNFSHIASHNLRSPVSNLNSLLGLYRESGEEAEKEVLFSHIETVTHHLATTLNDLVESLKTQEEDQLEREWINFEEVFQKMEETFTADILETRVQLTRDFSKVEKVVYNRSYLESIMLNLLSNAFKYRAADRKPHIHFESFGSEGGVGLKVRDNGQGIDMEKYGDQLFGLNKTFHGHAEGKGVGLYLIKTQLESMGGSITAESTVGEGTEFKVLLYSVERQLS